MRRFLSVLCILLCFCLSSAGAEENLLRNPGFEDVDGSGLPLSWMRDAWYTTEGYTTYAVEATEDGGRCASIHNIGENDARFAQTVSVKPDAYYRLSGYIQAWDVADAGWGANLSVSGVYASTEGLFETGDGWTYVEMYGRTGPDQTEVTVFARLGGYSGESEGYARFDNLSLTQVSAIPSGALALPWYAAPAPAQEADTDEDTASSAFPFWPWLVCIGMLALLFFVILSLALPREEPLEEAKGLPRFLVPGLVLAALLHWFIAAFVRGYPVDIGCFLSWGSTMRMTGPGGFYLTTSFCDYPPAYLFVLGLNQLVTDGLRAVFGQSLPALLSEEVVIKFLPCLCDLLLAALLYREGVRQGLSRRQAGVLSLACAFHPVLILNSAAWGQVDIVMTVLLCLLVLCALRGQWDWVLPLFVLSVLVKPQALMLGFLGLCVLIAAFVRNAPGARKKMGLGLVYSLLTAAVIVLPFSRGQDADWLVQLYANTLSSYAHPTVNTANLYYLFSLNWASLTDRTPWGIALILALVAGGWGAVCTLHRKGHRFPFLETALMGVCCVFFLVCGITGQSLAVTGYGAMALAFLVVLPLYLRAGDVKKLPLCGALLFLLLYALGIKMHERYLFPALAFLFLAFVLERDGRVLALLGAVTLTMFVNEGIILDNALRLGDASGHLNADTDGLARVLSGLNLLCVPLGLWIGFDQMYMKAPAYGPLRLPVRTGAPVRRGTWHEKPLPPMRRRDWALMLGVAAVYSVVALWNLGSTRAPQTTWVSTASRETITLDLGDVHQDFSMLYYCEVSYYPFTVETSDDGVNFTGAYHAEMDQGQCFRWKYLMPSWESEDGYTWGGGNTYHAVQKLSGRYVRIRADQIGLRLNEVIFRESRMETGADGSLTEVSGDAIPFAVISRTEAASDSPLLSDPDNIGDEQDSLEGEPSWYNSTYFDEIYHARTALEHLRGTAPYETTHPPLGKVLMSLGIALFGMTPFGWRFMGALMGILMLPAMHALGRRLTGRNGFGLAAEILMALDCMHLTQTRIATIDSFPVCFILLAYLCMLIFMQKDILRASMKTLLLPLGLSGFFMGCAVASKWIGIYAGAGLAVLYFWTMARHMRRLQTDPSPALSGGFRRLIMLCLWCIPFFVLVPAAIYLLSYIPYFAYQHPTGPLAFLRLVWSAQTGMMSYHSTPGLGMDHPFYSPWYEWPTIARPMYYAMAYYMPEGRSLSIFCFGNPVVWYSGLLGILGCVCLFVWNHLYIKDRPSRLMHASGLSPDSAPAFVLLSLLAQFLPWVLVPRGTYIYHYFASVPFLILGTVLTLSRLQAHWEKPVRIGTILYLLAALACFIILYPYASGMEVSIGYLDLGKELLNVYYQLPYG
ncbi:MAG: phospholipid carrier-dependent glycosyltransferase [Clostridia bacterium]|nr:phospholipid carrier-dependent glycosyltransferase [Clostridia bacterium]